jgi:hypothetical protein
MRFAFSDIQNYVFALKECTKPSYKIESTQHVLINHTFNYPKNLVWQPITIKLVTARNNCNCWLLSQAVESHTRISGYLTPDKEQKVQIGKLSMTNAFGGSLDIIQVDEDGEELEKWELINPIITDVKYGTLSYENDGFVDTDLTVLYDYAKYAEVGGDHIDGLNPYPVSPGKPKPIKSLGASDLPVSTTTGLA